ncbi:MAG: amino acid permease [Bacteroidota bacterium]
MKQKISLPTATSIVIANMVGTGVFASLGFQLAGIQSVFAILLLWLIGGVIALCGAMTYGELGANLLRSGGEYLFLSKMYHPSLGFVSGWVSATVGFAAPTALVCMTFGEYLDRVFPQLNSTLLAVGLLIIITLVHTSSVKRGSSFQRVFTFLKVLLILVFVFIILVFGQNPQPINIIPTATDWGFVFTPAFVVSLIYVSYAYTGWNAAAYLIDELEDPQKNLPKSLWVGTAVVTLLYLMLNYAFLYAAPMDKLANEVEVGYVASVFALGETGGVILSVMLAILLISTASAMVFAGPRVLEVMGQDYPFFARLSRRNERGVPVLAILIQSVISLIFILSASFDTVLVYAGFVLGLMTFFSVGGVFILRAKGMSKPETFRTKGYPLPPIIYMVIVGGTLYFLLQERPFEALSGLATVALGVAAFFLTNYLSKPKGSQ